MTEPMSDHPPAAADPEDGYGGGAIPGTGPGNKNPLAQIMSLKAQ